MSDRHRFGRVEVRCAERQLLLDGEPAKLGARAFDLLLALVERRERVVSKNELLDLVWPGLVAIAWLTWLGFSIPIFLGLSALLVPARQGSSRLGFHRFT